VACALTLCALQVHGEHGALEFTLPYLHSIVHNGEEVHTTYGDGPPFAELPPDAPGAPHGLHAGLGVEALAVQTELLNCGGAAGGGAAAAPVGPGTAYLPLDVMRAMAHFMDLVRRQIPTHMRYRAPAAAADLAEPVL
jgi:hypothetical protein